MARALSQLSPALSSGRVPGPGPGSAAVREGAGAQHSPVIQPLQEVGAQPRARPAGDGVAKHKALEGSRRRRGSAPRAGQRHAARLRASLRGQGCREGAEGRQRLAPAPPDHTLLVPLLPEGGGICFSARTTKCNRCSGASRIPRSPNQTSEQLRRHLQDPGGGIKWTRTFSALSLGKPSRLSEAKLPLANFRAASPSPCCRSYNLPAYFSNRISPLSVAM